MNVIEYIVNIIAPHQCLICHTDGSLLCLTCSKILANLPERCYRCHHLSEGFRTCTICRRNSPLYSVRAATTYDTVAKDLLRALKFKRASAGAAAVAAIMAARYKSPDGALITHVPTANARVRSRGYDQAELVARALALQTGQRYLPLLARMGGERQLGKRRETRQEQMRSAFRPLNRISFQEKQILLVDDVLTTGATCEAAARILRQAGAARVSAFVFAVA